MTTKIERQIIFDKIMLAGEERGDRADLADMDLACLDLTSANLAGANLASANLTGANLTSANLTGADLTSANLTGANLTSANLTGANLTGANLYGADLYGADLSGVNIALASTYGAIGVAICRQCSSSISSLMIQHGASRGWATGEPACASCELATFRLADAQPFENQEAEREWHRARCAVVDVINALDGAE